MFITKMKYSNFTCHITHYITPFQFWLSLWLKPEQNLKQDYMLSNPSKGRETKAIHGLLIITKAKNNTVFFAYSKN